MMQLGPYLKKLMTFLESVRLNQLEKLYYLLQEF